MNNNTPKTDAWYNSYYNCDSNFRAGLDEGRLHSNQLELELSAARSSECRLADQVAELKTALESAMEQLGEANGKLAAAIRERDQEREFIKADSELSTSYIGRPILTHDAIVMLATQRDFLLKENLRHIKELDIANEENRMMQDSLNRLVSKSKSDQKAKCLRRKLDRIGKWL